MNGSSQAHRPQPSGVNPFARALAEARGGTGNDNAQDFAQSPNLTQEQKTLKEQQKTERLRQELFRKVNPVDQKDVFNARKEQIKQEIQNIRHDLKLLIQELTAFKNEISIELMSNVVDPGDQGKYHLTFYQKMREFIMLLRKKVHSTRTWAHTMSSKKSRQKGLNFKQKGHSQTKTVWESMHHERSMARAGG